MRYIDTKNIQDFVTRVENKKGFIPDPNLIFRHMVEEVGELSAAMWKLEVFVKEHLNRYGPWSGDIPSIQKRILAGKLVDIISLCVYMATVHRINLNEIFPIRFNEIADQYGVEGVKKENETH